MKDLSAHSYASSGTTTLLTAVSKAIVELADYLKSSRANPDLLLLSEQELETSLQNKTSLLPLLHEVLELVERSDVASVRPELLSSLRRRVHLDFPQADVIVVSTIDLNYSIVELRTPLENILHEFGIALPDAFPKQLFVATIPAVEHDQALLHCILGHELGHSLYEARGLEAKILPITIDENYLKQIRTTVGKVADATVGGGPPGLDDISKRREITEKVNSTITNWIRELASDVFGLLTFGPAFLLAFLRFTASHQRLDYAGDTHPPGRLRLKLIFRLLDKQYPSNSFSDYTRSFLSDWRRIANEDSPPTGSDIDQLALRSINDSVLDRVRDAVETAVKADTTYTPDRYRRAATALVDLINAHIPPNELLNPTTTAFEPTGTVDILNAGWEVFLGGCTVFRTGLMAKTDAEVQLKLNALLMKALELHDARLTWQEAAARVT